jgi:hypothetical protein
MNKILVAVMATLLSLCAVSAAQAAPYRNALGLDLSKVGAPSGAIMSEANSGTSPDLSNQDNNADVQTLAAALVFAKTGDTAMRDKVCRNLDKVQGTEAGARALAVARGVQAYALAADYVNAPANCANEPKFRSWLSGIRRFATTGGPSNIITCDEQRPNNWGTHCGASRIAVDIYLGDTADLQRAATVFRGWTGERSAYAGFSYGDLSWQADSSKPVGVNPVGAKKGSLDVDGVLPDDQRRGGSCCTLTKENYVWEALQGATTQALLLAVQGYDSLNWGNRAIQRAVAWEYRVNNFPATGDDHFLPYIVNRVYGTSFSTSSGSAFGKGMGGSEWFAPALTVSANATAPATTPAPAPTTTTPAPAPTTTTPAPAPTTTTPAPVPTTTTPAPVPTTTTPAPVPTTTTPAPAPTTTTPAPAPTSQTIGTTADYYVEGGTTYNSGNVLIDGSPARVGYFRFAVPAGSAPKSATLRLFNVATASSTGNTVEVRNAAGTVVAKTTIGSAAGWNTVTIPGSALAAGKEITIVVKRSATSRTDYASREASTNRPQLVIAR